MLYLALPECCSEQWCADILPHECFVLVVDAEKWSCWSCRSSVLLAHCVVDLGALGLGHWGLLTVRRTLAAWCLDACLALFEWREDVAIFYPYKYKIETPTSHCGWSDFPNC